MANGRGGTWGPGPAATNVGEGSYEYAMHQNKEPYGPSYDMVMSQKTGEVVDRQDPHFMGNLLPSAHSRTDDRAHEFFSGQDVMG
jgi:hypothetical protein